MNFYPWFKWWAFKFDAEIAHELALSSFKSAPFLAEIFPHLENIGRKYTVKVGTLNWSFPVGLAAGLDKNAEAIDFFSRLGFGAVEVGTVTVRAQNGNPRPRLFRYPKEESLRNQMGFNNVGAKKVLANIAEAQNSRILGVNLGKNKNTTTANAPSDYQSLYKTFAPVADYLVVNVSSPNTPGLRDLQKKEELEAIFKAIETEREKFSRPLFVKISPDLNFADVEDVVELAQKYSLEGIIATNTTLMPELGAGGVSGRLLLERSQKIRAHLLQCTRHSKLEVIGVGGISSFEDLLQFWRQGGKVVQIYTSFIYQGPQLLVDIKKGIDELMEKEKAKNLAHLIEMLGPH